jgi:MerR family copper efflux transcriptional regulator
MNKYSIGEVSKITGLPAKTLRFYEEKGVINPPKREENGYRYFSEENLEEIKLIKNARDLGLPLTEIKKLVVGCEEKNCKHPEEFIKRTIENYTELLSERIKQMTLLRSKLIKLEKSGPYCCGILHQLSINNCKGGEYK